MDKHYQPPRKFIITQATLEDAEGIGEAQLQSWRETYPNEELGISEEWVQEAVGHVAEEGGNNFRRKTIEESLKPDSSTLYLVVKNSEGKARGFLHVTRKEPVAYFDAIYLTKEVQGTGVAHDLMQKALNFLKGLPVEVRAASYNDRALKFYEQYGFKVTGELEELHKGKMPITVMVREADES